MSDVGETDSFGVEGNSLKDKVLSLFRFIEKLNQLKCPVVLNINDYDWSRRISTFPNDFENISVYCPDYQDEADEGPRVLLSVHKPLFEPCPEPDPCFAAWLEDGWKNYRNAVETKPSLPLPCDVEQQILFEDSLDLGEDTNEEESKGEEAFEDNPERVNAYNAWKEERTIWAQRQRVIESTRDLFSTLYRICVDLERSPETLELVVADGFIRSRKNTKIDHPILTRRVSIRHDVRTNTINVEDVDVETVFYSDVFQAMKQVDLTTIKPFISQLREDDYHPLDGKRLSDFLSDIANKLTSKSLYSSQGEPENWQDDNDVLLYRSPCYILRKRIDGTAKAIEQILEQVADDGEIPAPIKDIVEGGLRESPEDLREESIAERLAAIGGESVDILLAKEANKEQLAIARQIENHSAVLVQGPPGTGKTHTIANLMGHFLAQGKTVLVTSQTPKALSVLKEKIPDGLQSLCVSLLDDSNKDMVKSIDGITEHMSKTTSLEIEGEMEALKQERKHVLDELASVRQKIFTILNREYQGVVFNGEGVSPREAIAFIKENDPKLSYIPGNVQLRVPLPLNDTELEELYRSNGEISLQDEEEFKCDLPNPANLLSPTEFAQKCELLQATEEQIKAISERHQWQVANSLAERTISIKGEDWEISLAYPSSTAVQRLQFCLPHAQVEEPWGPSCIVDGQKGGQHKQLWEQLTRLIKETYAHAESFVADRFDKNVKILNSSQEYLSAIKALQEHFRQGKSVGKLTLLFNKQLGVALDGATIDGQKPKTVKDCELIINVISLNSKRLLCARFWDKLIAKNGGLLFFELDKDEPERIAEKYIHLIQKNLNWSGKEYEILKGYMEAVGLPCGRLFRCDPLDSETVATAKILAALKDELPDLCNLLEKINTLTDIRLDLRERQQQLQSGKHVHSTVCQLLLNALENRKPQSYSTNYEILSCTYNKLSLAAKRKEYLRRLEKIAPQWAEAIHKRQGIHGASHAPKDIYDAWQWKQYCGIIDEITKEPFTELQEKSRRLSKAYREVTTQYAEKSAWYYLLCRTERDLAIQQALVGWKQTIARIGKGYGKNVPEYRAAARKLMVKCQESVPAWIMPIGKAMESLNPQKNRFDIVIIDEASQADISALAILYMGKKSIIVGDDKQVSPAAIGFQVEEIARLRSAYIDGRIPNSHLYDAKASIYDIAATTFRPLMLREHFRCVPEIISFSNYFIYDNKIKPLRDEHGCALLPAVVNYRVEDGKRENNKTNPKEARTIVALLKACIEQPEYEGKTFGIISLLGDHQVRQLQEEVDKYIDIGECQARRILCGNASNFQGDERDVIFLSMVDSPKGNGPLPRWDTPEFHKRYNVATSRAKDQLWVVDSLDPATDLQSNDIRKKLITFSLDPEGVTGTYREIERKSESPFETAVATYLVSKGYHIVQQWAVGAYRLDMVVIYENRGIAIECDGDRYHSGEEKTRKDMERQTLLERIGWRFIRIRGSEYYNDPEATMERVIEMLAKEKILPEEGTCTVEEAKPRETELLRRVKLRAHEILKEMQPATTDNQDALAFALGNRQDDTVQEGLNLAMPNEEQ